MLHENIKRLFIKEELIPAIIQEKESGDILMLGYMDNEALSKTRKSGYVWFWSRSRNKLWMKGEESGNKLRVIRIFADCDNDTLLIKVKVMGKAVCHRGTRSCFTKLSTRPPNL